MCHILCLLIGGCRLTFCLQIDSERLSKLAVEFWITTTTTNILCKASYCHQALIRAHQVQQLLWWLLWKLVQHQFSTQCVLCCSLSSKRLYIMIYSNDIGPKCRRKRRQEQEIKQLKWSIITWLAWLNALITYSCFVLCFLP